MFCADYIASFIFHAGACAFLPPHFVGALTASGADDHVKKVTVVPFIFGGLVGCAAAAVYPFDVVRGSIQPGVRSAVKLGSFSVVPYASIWFGMYFVGRDRKSLHSQVLWGVASSTAAAIAEAPFDHAKKEMFRGSSEVAARITTSALWVPFAATILIAYDRALERRC